MKEATGEANITVITIVLIAIVLGVGTLIVNNVLSNTKKSSCCNSVGGYWKAGKCWTKRTLKSGGDEKNEADWTYSVEISPTDKTNSFYACLNNK